MIAWPGKGIATTNNPITVMTMVSFVLTLLSFRGDWGRVTPNPYSRTRVWETGLTSQRG